MSTRQPPSRAWQTLRKKTALWRGIAVLTVLLGVVGLLLIARVRASRADASVVDSNTSSPISLTVWVPCAAGGAGELVALSGNLHDVFHLTLDGSGGFHLDAHDNPQGVSGVGETTGTQYQGTGVTRFNENGTAGGTQVFTEVNNFRIIGQGPGNNLTVHENIHITVNPDGTVTSFHDNISIDCQ